MVTKNIYLILKVSVKHKAPLNKRTLKFIFEMKNDLINWYDIFRNVLNNILCLDQTIGTIV